VEMDKDRIEIINGNMDLEENEDKKK